ncbi:hypothetical protein FDP41_000665 [Naegleria fowleri]|uniref:C2 domain-containing protein n=1 Tax=Naegleria fowleri TaxID=5763 RepID=A0A6A5CAJ7_NAEFO|nr:uncharacterized protein FDP41_000665 [Naegleria fowleri]KAF0984766.1 hypothetical protein FDP41_000665 [Naegleria fowleri]CAG4716433.1 unnamed protein product [Naegleria fowleri]
MSVSRLLQLGSPSVRDEIRQDVYTFRHQQHLQRQALSKPTIPLSCGNDYISLKSGDVIRIKVLKGEDLVSCDLNGLSDPFVRIYVKGFSEVPQTTVIKKSLNASWNQEFAFCVTDPELSSIDIVFKMMDKDTFSDDDFMGQASVFLTKQDFPAMNTFKNFTLSLMGVDHGSLSVSVGVYRGVN